MQLFVTKYTKKDNTVTISNAELLSQLRKVLRANIGDIIRIQSPDKEQRKTRYELRIELRDDKTLDGTIISEQFHESTLETRGMIIAMPNKRDKAELIAQKLTECGIDQIVFRPSERSVIKERNEKKAERIQKIIKEAVEQSWGRSMPELVFTKELKDIIKNHPLVIFDRHGTEKLPEAEQIYGIIGPEGGFTPRDHKLFETFSPKKVALGETVLRMETAAIIGGRLLKNNGKLIMNNE